jgi:hypothetical protein
MGKILDLFERKIDRRIEEVIKVDQADEDVVFNELTEYVVTPSIKNYFLEVLECYEETPRKPHEGIGVWVSGFFGSGKSSFAKILGYILEARMVKGRPASEIFAEQAADDRITVLLRKINRQIPTTAVIFDLATDRGVTSGAEMLTEIAYRAFLRHLGYSDDLDLAELEIALESAGRLEQFRQLYAEMYGQPWEEGREYIGFAKSEASAVMHRLDPATYPAADSWARTTRHVDISANDFAVRAFELLERRRPGTRNLVFVVDEVGQYVSRSTEKMLDLQGLVQAFGRVGRGRAWLVVTSQEKLDEVVDNLEGKKSELARLRDRFPLNVDLAPADISEVTSRRVLTKKPAAEEALQELYRCHQGAMGTHTALTGGVHQPLDSKTFARLYPFVPYQIDLIINIVSGMRTQSGVSRHMGGSNRTIIKLAQQLIIHPRVNLGEEEVGRLVTLDMVYDLMEGNISYERKKDIAEIARAYPDPLVSRVARAVCLLEFSYKVPGTAENIAAVLYPAVGAPSLLPRVREALEILVRDRRIKEGEEGYELLTAEGKLWEEKRQGFGLDAPGEKRLQREFVDGLFKTLKPYRHAGLKNFTPALELHGERLGREGDVPFILYLASDEQYGRVCDEAREKSRAEQNSLFWVVPLDEQVQNLFVEVYRSEKMVETHEREMLTRELGQLVADEKRRLSVLKQRLSGAISLALLNGTTYFQGVAREARGLGDNLQAVVHALLELSVPVIFDRFDLAAVPVKGEEAGQLLASTNLAGLPAVVYDGPGGLHLVHKKGRTYMINLNAPCLTHVQSFIAEEYRKTSQPVSGRALETRFRGFGYGWDLEVIMLIAAALFRGAAVEVYSQGRLYRSYTVAAAREVFLKVPLFRAAGFTPRQGSLTLTDLVNAAQAYQEIYGETPEHEVEAIFEGLRQAFQKEKEIILPILTAMHHEGLPGRDNLESFLATIQGIMESAPDEAVKVFADQRQEFKAAIDALRGLQEALSGENLARLKRARMVLDRAWPVLQKYGRPDDGLEEAAGRLKENLAAPSFYRRLPAINADTAVLAAAYGKLYRQVFAQRAEAYRAVLEEIRNRPEWITVPYELRSRVTGRLEEKAGLDMEIRDDLTFQPPVEQMKSDLDAVDSLRRAALLELEKLTAPQVPIRRVRLGKFVRTSLSSVEELDAALARLREECIKAFAEGARVIIE